MQAHGVPRRSPRSFWEAGSVGSAWVLAYGPLGVALLRNHRALEGQL